MIDRIKIVLTVLDDAGNCSIDSVEFDNDIVKIKKRF